MKIASKWTLLLTSLLALGLMACSEEDEQTKLGKAQACLDKAGDDPNAAAACESYLGSLSSAKVSAMRCSIKFIAGGINTDRLVSAVQQISDGENKESVFASTLVFNGLPGGSATQAMTNVQAAAAHCNASGVAGLMFLSNFSVVGTTLMVQYEKAGATINWSDPSSAALNLDPSSGQFGTAVSDCSTGSNGCDTSAVGTAILTLGDSYCAGKEDDDETCANIKQAIAAGGGDPSAVGQQFMQLVGTD